MDFAIPQALEEYYAELETFIETVIEPMVAKDDNQRFFDHRREDARTDWERGGLPAQKWEELLGKARKAADEAVASLVALERERAEGDALQRGDELADVVVHHIASSGPGIEA